jgi:hypothetical protein
VSLSWRRLDKDVVLRKEKKSGCCGIDKYLKSNKRELRIYSCTNVGGMYRSISLLECFHKWPGREVKVSYILKAASGFLRYINCVLLGSSTQK